MRAPRPGFTIVELLIVIVVIGILAAISIIAYNGINTKAAEASLQSDLTNASKQLGMIHAEQGSYPLSLPSDAKATKDNTLHYEQLGSGTGYCMTAISSRSSVKSYHISSTNGKVAEGSCSGHPTGGGSGGEGGGGSGDGGTMQAFTPSQCSSLDIYTGSNPNAIITLTDSRGGTTQSYEVAKLADNNCWMLNNLKLGSTTSTTTLTPSDTNITSNFTLPQLNTGGSEDYDNPGAYGPIPGDTGSGATNYGYLYNWSAATAGESRLSMPAGGGNASNSICPAGWRLPTGGSAGEFAQLDIAFGGTGSYVVGGPSLFQWQGSGSFRGVLNSLYTVGGLLWSASAAPGSANGAYFMSFTDSYVLPGTGTHLNGLHRYAGMGVRCLLR